MCRNLLLKCILLILAMGGLLSVRAIDLTNVDLSHQYDPDAPARLVHRVTQSGGIITVYLDVTTDSTSVWVREFFLQRGYDASEEVLLNPSVETVESTNVRWRGTISFPAPNHEDLLVVRLASDFEFYFDVPLRNGRLPFPGLVPLSKGEPVLTSYLVSTSLHWNTDRQIQVSSYVDKAGPAEAPMEEMKQLAPILSEDTLFVMVDSTFLQEYNFYYFREDSASDKGLTLFKAPPYYPTFRMIHELIGPMRYLTTDAEYRALTQSNKPKRTFDEFWINTYGTKFRARNAIRKYFKSVEYANQYFTLFKAGWKTDQGMVFIVYGTPMQMFRTDNTETWIYDDVSFEFIKVSTLFGPYYALRKDRKYEKEWYNQVGRLRKGE